MNQLLLEQEKDGFSKPWGIWPVVLIGRNGNLFGSPLRKVKFFQASQVISCGVLCWVEASVTS